MPAIDYLTNIPIKDHPARAREYVRLEKAFGYLPAVGPSIQELKQAEKILDDICKAYPTPPNRWVVEVRSGMVTVVNEMLDPDFGWRGKEGVLDNDGHNIRKFAGRLLEMYGQDGQQVRDFVEAKRDTRGNVLRLT